MVGKSMTVTKTSPRFNKELHYTDKLHLRSSKHNLGGLIEILGLKVPVRLYYAENGLSY